MKTSKYFNLTIALLILFGCQKEKISTRDYPRIDIYNDIMQNESGVTFKANIFTEGASEIISKGFVWSSEFRPTLSSSKIVVTDNLLTGDFEAIAQHDFVLNSNYTVRAFVQTKNYIIYSKEITFKSTYSSPAPEIFDFNPKLGKWGDTIKIEGENFSYLENAISIMFDDVNALVISCSDTYLTTIVPQKENNGEAFLKVTINNKTGVSSEKFSYIKPIIQDYFPKNGTFLDTLTIQGKEFPENKSFVNIKIGGVTAKVIEISPTQIKVQVPAEISNSEVDLIAVVSGTSKAFTEKFILNPSRISSFNPAEVFQANTIISIFGFNFNPMPQKNIVYIGKQLAEVTEASAKLLKVKVPSKLISDAQISVIDTLAVSVTISGQKAFAPDSLRFTYLSRWTRKTDFPGQARIFAVSFGTTSKGYYGLGSFDENGISNYNDFWEYDPKNDNWNQKSSIGSNARGLFAYFVISDRLYVCCGLNSFGVLNEVWEYNPASDIWTKKNNFPGDARYKAFGFSINGKGYVGGGMVNTTSLGYKYDFWEYNPSTDSWTKKGDIPKISSGFSHENINAYSNGAYGYILGDTYGSPQMKRDFYKYNPSTDIWVQVNKMPGPYEETTGFSINSNTYIGTGLFSDWGGTDAFYKYDTQTNIWTSIGFKGGARRAASGFSIGNKGYIIGGKHDSHEANLVDVWQFDPTK